jgi:hypothetical protein
MEVVALMDRRELLKAAAHMAWVAPVIEAVEIPAHAESSPTPELACVAVQWSGPSSVALPNSGAATELAFANQYSQVLLQLAPDGTPGPYGVVLVKAGRLTYVYPNAFASFGAQIEGKGISHISKFVCR